MNEEAPTYVLNRERVARSLAIAILSLLGILALFGPSGVMAWAENLSMLDKRKAEIAHLEAERDELRNRVALLNPAHADPDLVGELLRSKLNVAHPDDVVVTIPR